MTYKYIRLNPENIVQEIVDSEIHISERFHADVASLFKEIPTNTEVEIGWLEISTGVYEPQVLVSEPAPE